MWLIIHGIQEIHIDLVVPRPGGPRLLSWHGTVLLCGRRASTLTSGRLQPQPWPSSRFVPAPTTVFNFRTFNDDVISYVRDPVIKVSEWVFGLFTYLWARRGDPSVQLLISYCVWSVSGLAFNIFCSDLCLTK